jgi:hypothetical protein
MLMPQNPRTEVVAEWDENVASLRFGVNNVRYTECAGS